MSSAHELLGAAFEITLNANDFFGFACADAVIVEYGSGFDLLAKMVEDYGQDGINAFMSWHEGCDPLPDYRNPRYEEARAKLGPARAAEPQDSGREGK